MFGIMLEVRQENSFFFFLKISVFIYFLKLFPKKKKDGRIEDQSHAVSDLRFVTALIEHGPSGLFSSTHGKRFANTFLRHAALDPNNVWSHVSPTYGKQDNQESYRRALVNKSFFFSKIFSIKNVLLL